MKQSTNPLAEILVATFQGERYLAEQLDSLLAQTYRPLRILVRDDGSTDRSPEILAAYCKQHPGLFFPVPSKQNGGIVQNFSLLLQASTANYLFLCDQDDVWQRDKVEKMIRRMQGVEQDPSIPCLVHSDLAVVRHDLGMLAPSFWEYAGLRVEENPPFPKICLRNEVTGCALMMNRALVKKVGPIPSEALMHDFWIAMAAAAFGKIALLPEAAVRYRQHGNNSLGAQKFRWRRWIWQGLYALFTGKRGTNFRRLLLQARAFHERYSSTLSEENREWLSSLLELPSLPFYRRLRLARKVGLFRSPSLRTWIQGACLLLPLKPVNLSRE